MEDLIKVRDAFIKEVADASKGESTSLPFLKVPLSEKAQLVPEETFQAITIGGSIYHSSLAKKHFTNIRILSYDTGNIPIFASRDNLFNFLLDHLDPSITTLVINFAYPLEAIIRDSKLDGVLIRATKEHQFEGLVGKKVGEEFEQYIFNKTGRSISVSVANDTVCLLLSGLTLQGAERLACLIVGTGLNSAFFIDEKTIVNLESANFDKFEQSESGKALDKDSSNPGSALFEKEVSGAYLFRHLRYELEKRNIHRGEINSTKVLSEIASGAIPEVTELANQILNRSAGLVAAQMAGIAEFKKTDLVVVTEGSLFWRGYNYKETVEYTLTKLTQYTIRFVQIENSGVIGAAMLV